MRTRRLLGRAIGCAAALVILRTAGAAAQDSVRSPLTYSAELAARQFVNDLLSPQQMGKFLEYKAAPSGLVVNNLFVRYQPGNGVRSYQVTGQRIGQRDQTIWARATQPGKFDAQIFWDGIPHTFSTTARLLDTRPAPNIFVLPSPRPDTAAMNRAGFIEPIRDLWQPLKVALAYTLAPGWDSKAEYTRIARSGARPISMSYGGSPGVNQREVMEPVDHTIQNVKLSQGYSVDRFTVQAAFNLSTFDNTYTSVTADNPIRTTDDATLGSSKGRLSLPPSNIATTATVNGALALPMSTRITAGGSFSTWRQNEPFLPITINSAIVDPRIDSLPKSLHGEAGTTAMNISATTRPISSVTVTARARTFEFRDKASVHALPVSVVNDRVLGGADTSERSPFSRNNADFKVTWRALRPLSVFGGFAYERTNFEGEETNVEHLTEHTPSVGIDVMGNQWVSFRGVMSQSKRRLGPKYDTLTYMPQFRRYHQADRDRTRFTLLSSVTPLDQITISGTWETGRDEYINTAYGMQYDRSAMVGGDIDWTPTTTFGLSGGLTYETTKNQLKDRYRTPTQIANPTFDWIANNSDVVHTAYGTMNVVVIPDKVTGNVLFQSSKARFRLMARNPTQPAGGSASDRASATATDFPMVKQLMQTVNAAVTYRVSRDWAATVRAQGELYSQVDYRSDNLMPATGIHVFLGNYFLPYNAQYITFSVTYRPLPAKGVRSTI